MFFAHVFPTFFSSNTCSSLSLLSTNFCLKKSGVVHHSTSPSTSLCSLWSMTIFTLIVHHHPSFSSSSSSPPLLSFTTYVYICSYVIQCYHQWLKRTLLEVLNPPRFAVTPPLPFSCTTLALVLLLPRAVPCSIRDPTQQILLLRYISFLLQRINSDLSGSCFCITCIVLECSGTAHSKRAYMTFIDPSFLSFCLMQGLGGPNHGDEGVRSQCLTHILYSCTRSSLETDRFQQKTPGEKSRMSKNRLRNTNRL